AYANGGESRVSWPFGLLGGAHGGCSLCHQKQHLSCRNSEKRNPGRTRVFRPSLSPSCHCFLTQNKGPGASSCSVQTIAPGGTGKAGLRPCRSPDDRAG